MKNHIEKLRVAALGATATILAGRWLVTSAYGYLLLALIAYYLAGWFAASRPLTPSELGQWLIVQPRDVTIAIAQTLVTVVGFMLAFAVANFAWRNQRRTELRLAAGDEIQGFFQEICDLLISMGIYAELLSEMRAMLDSPSSQSEVGSKADAVVRRTPEFVAARQRLSRLAIQVHSLRQKHELVLAQQFLAMRCFQAAQDALERASKSMWILAPESIESPVGTMMFVSKCDSTTWKTFEKDADEARKRISMTAGAIRGLFISDVIKPNASMLAHIRKTSGELVDSLKSED